MPGPNGVAEVPMSDAAAVRRMDETDEKFRHAYTSLPPEVIRSTVEVQRQIFRIASGILIQSDVAFRRDKALQRMMLHDPDVMGPLLIRRYAVALLDWDVVPEDESDEQQKAQAERMKRGIDHNFRRPTDFLSHLESACWFGPSAAQVIYRDKVDRDGERLVYPARWLPVHSDTLAFNELGDLGLRVGYRFGEEIHPHGSYDPHTGVLGNSMGAVGRLRNPDNPGSSSKVPSYDGWVHMLDDYGEGDERDSFVLHTWNPTGADYEIPHETRLPYSGMGLRSICWYAWLMKQTALQLWMSWIERYSMGIRIGRYPEGNPTAKSDMESLLRNLIGDVSVAVPQFEDWPEAFSIEVLEAGGGAGRQKIFADLIEGYLAGQMKHMILGQTATTEATAEGLGTGVSSQHASTFKSIVKYDAKALEDSLSFEWIHRLHVMNHGDTDYRPRFEFSIEDVESKEFMEGVKAYVDMGGTVAQRQARNRLGIEEPNPGEPLLERQDPMGGMGGLGGGMGGGGGFDPFADDITPTTRRFRRAMRAR